jgi:hypothetical protein
MLHVFVNGKQKEALLGMCQLMQLVVAAAPLASRRIPRAGYFMTATGSLYIS